MRKTVLIALALAGCVTNPQTGRKQLLLTSEAQERQLGVQAYQEMLASTGISADPRETGPIRRVGERLAAVSGASDFAWEFNVIVDDGTMNAWCLPGGKIGVYTGIFPALHDEAGLAFVMGHEIAHALLRHGGERMSQRMAAGAAAGLLGAALGKQDEKTRGLVLGAFGLATNVGVLLPFSRSHESEADALGQELMARAGYDPRASVEVWKRMAAAGGDGPPEFLSTHPSHATRIADLESRMAAATAIYQAVPKSPNGVLPPIAKRKGAPGGGGGALVSVTAGRWERAKLEDGRQALALEFTLGGDAYVERAVVMREVGEEWIVEAKAGVPGGAARVVTLVRPNAAEAAFPPGRYVLELTGAVTGRPFRSPCAFQVR